MACCVEFQGSLNDTLSFSRQYVHVHVRHRLAGDLAVLHAELAPGRPRVRRLDDGGDAARREHEVVELVGAFDRLRKKSLAAEKRAHVRHVTSQSTAAA